MSKPKVVSPIDFIREKIEEDINTGRLKGRVATRFPPEPNGYLHIGHAKSICLNFGIAAQYGGACNLRLDDTDPDGESQEYVDAIITDVKWLGFDWGERLYFASAYYEKLYQYALDLIKKDRAYVCSLPADELRAYRGTLTEPGKESPYRNRSVTENLSLFARMRTGEFEEGTHVLRAKIDMASPNMLLRDPVIYRIKKEGHYRTGMAWCIYPMYDFAHGLSDAIEGITHSICTLEFENNRPLYDWFLQELDLSPRPQQIEFARLNLSYTVLSKRKLIDLVEKGHVKGWDDPRMPTIAGMQRRGYAPGAIRNFCERIGVARKDSLIDFSLLEYCVREDLNEKALRVMAVMRPLKVVIDNYPEGQVEEFSCPYHPQIPVLGSRKVPFSRVLYIEQDDFQENPSPKYYRLSVGSEVRLRYGYIIKCNEVVKNPRTGQVVGLHCTYDPESRNASAAANKRVKATIHWVSAAHAISAEAHLYDRLFTVADPLGAGSDLAASLNPESLTIIKSCQLEPSLTSALPGAPYQFERLGYFSLDAKESTAETKVWNRTVTLRDTWARLSEKV